MIRKEFINRKQELNALEYHYNTPGFEFIIISGRRRVGKSRLIEEFIKNKTSIYLLCENRPYIYNIKKFSKILSRFFNLPELNLTTLRDCFELITSLYNSKEKLVIVIDEFSYLVKQKNEVIAEMQGIIDEVLKDKNIFLILSGSAISLMQKDILSYSSPLYGRTTGAIILKPLSFADLFEWFSNSNIMDIIKIFSVTDGIPKYLEFFKGENPDKEIEKNIFNPYSFLFREMLQLLSEELRNPGIYINILEAISKGKNKVTEIANYAYIEAKEVVPYLNILQNLGFVTKVLPLFGKKGIYEITDNYTRFWFRFVSPYYSEIEEGFINNAVLDFKNNFNSYLGKIFEDIVFRLIRERKITIPINFTKIGKWWWRDKEIDIIGLNEHTKEALFCECKWSENVNPYKICKDLIENKIPYFNWYNDQRKEYIAIFAKSFKEKINEFEDRKVYCFDLNDIEKILK